MAVVAVPTFAAFSVWAPEARPHSPLHSLILFGLKDYTPVYFVWYVNNYMKLITGPHMHVSLESPSMDPLIYSYLSSKTYYEVLNPVYVCKM